MTVLLLSAGRRVELFQAIQSAATDLLGAGCKVLAADMRPDLSAACSFSHSNCVLPRVSDPGYLNALLSLCQHQNIKLVVPTIDTELLLLARQRESFADLGIDLLVSDPSLVELCRDKTKTPALFASIGIGTPLTLDVNSLQFPCFVKPVSGSCSHGVRSISSSLHLSQAELLDPSNIFQELVPPSWQEYTADCWFNRDGLLCSIVPRERLEVRGGEISKGVTRRGAVLELLRPALEKLEGARGCLTVQVFLSPDRDRLLGVEINPRFGGGYPLSHAAGAAFPEMMIRDWLLGEPISWIDSWQSDLLMLRYDSMVLRSLG